MDLAQLHAQQSLGWTAEPSHPSAEWFEQIVTRLLDMTDVGLGQRVINLGASGLSAVIAAQRGARVTAVVSTQDGRSTIERASAAAPPASIAVEIASASALPFPSASFDVILSVFSIQFEPNPFAVVEEIARVAKPGAILGLTLWDTDSPLGSFLSLLDRFVPASTEAQELRAWGVAAEAEQRLARHFGELEFRFANAPLYADSPEALWDRYLQMPSPTRDAIANLDEEQTELLTIAAIEQFRLYTDFTGRVEWPREYLLVRGLRSF